MRDHRARRHGTLTRRRFLWRAGGVAALTRWFQGWPRLMAAQAQKHEPRGQMIWAIHVTMAPTRFDPPKTPGVITPFMFLYTLHDALVKPIPGKSHVSQSGHALGRESGRADICL